MSKRTWRLAQFRFDEGIEADEVSVLLDDGPRRTALWNGRWNTCDICGCVLLPDTAADRCAEHGGPEA